MKYAIVLFISFFVIACTDHKECILEEHNIFLPLSDTQTKYLDTINSIIFKNNDLIIDYAIKYTGGDSNMFESDKRNRANFYWTTPELLKSYLSKPDSIQVERCFQNFYSSKNVFLIGQINFIASDSTVMYNIKTEYCDNPDKFVTVYHKLLFRTKRSTYNKYKEYDFVMEKNINQNWIYYIQNTEWHGI